MKKNNWFFSLSEIEDDELAHTTWFSFACRANLNSFKIYLSPILTLKDGRKIIWKNANKLFSCVCWKRWVFLQCLWMRFLLKLVSNCVIQWLRLFVFLLFKNCADISGKAVKWEYDGWVDHHHIVIDGTFRLFVFFLLSHSNTYFSTCKEGRYTNKGYLHLLFAFCLPLHFLLNIVIQWGLLIQLLINNLH
jgi:hypothetical protein